MDRQKVDAILCKSFSYCGSICFCSKIASEAISEHLVFTNFLREVASRPLLVLHSYAHIHTHIRHPCNAPSETLAMGLNLPLDAQCLIGAHFLMGFFVTFSLQETCPGDITQYQISFHTSIVNVSNARCTAERCSHTFVPPSNPPSSYESVSVAAENVVGVGSARPCTAQNISELNLPCILWTSSPIRPLCAVGVDSENMCSNKCYTGMHL